MAFELKNGQWHLSQAGRSWPLSDFTLRERRPFYLYDLDDALSRAHAFLNSGARVHYAMKANSHPRLLAQFAKLGLGADVVSLGELQTALACGFAPDKIIFSGVGKGEEELAFACARRIFQINVESFEELRLLEAVARRQSVKAPVAIRINIHVAAPTHKNIQTATEDSKFGLDVRQLPEALDWLKGKEAIDLAGLAVHVGSQIMDVSVFHEVGRKMGELLKAVEAKGFKPRHLDLGGGLGLDYHSAGEDDMGRLPAYFDAALKSHGGAAKVILEPGRFLVARMGMLAAQVVHVKQGINRRFAILNAGMNALMRPALYQAYHRISVISRPVEGPMEPYSVVGPLCESTDVFAETRELCRLQPGDWVGIFDAGAYGAVMANTYNEMPLPAQYSLLGGDLEVL